MKCALATCLLHDASKHDVTIMMLWNTIEIRYKYDITLFLHPIPAYSINCWKHRWRHCRVVSSESMVAKLTFYPASNVTKLSVKTFVVLQMTPYLDSELLSRLITPNRYIRSLTCWFLLLQLKIQNCIIMSILCVF